MRLSKEQEKDEVLFRMRKVLDKGFVRLVDYMGDDRRIVQAARVSYGEGTKTLRADRGLIRYLMRNAHTSPFEQVVFTFHVKMPIFVARQWVRHRTARLNEVSARYSVMKDEFYVPLVKDINGQATHNKQTRKDESLSSEICEQAVRSIEKTHEACYESYEQLLNDGIAREISRITLPTSLYTEMYWQIDLHNLLHFLKLRDSDHAQREIRAYARVLHDVLKEICPLAAEAFEDYVEQKVEFHKDEREILARLLRSVSDADVLALAQECGMESTRDREAFLEKYRQLRK